MLGSIFLCGGHCSGVRERDLVVVQCVVGASSLLLSSITLFAATWRRLVFQGQAVSILRAYRWDSFSLGREETCVFTIAPSAHTMVLLEMGMKR